MSFAQTYRSEVLQSRRDRSRRAFFWARIVGFALMITVGATLRSDPETSQRLMLAAMDMIKPTGTGTTATAVPINSNLPTSRVKINRPSSSDTAVDVQALGSETAQQLDGLRR